MLGLGLSILGLSLRGARPSRILRRWLDTDTWRDIDNWSERP